MLPAASTIRGEFPAFAADTAPHYLDNAATTQIPLAVINAMRDHLCAGRGPVHRGLYPLAETASDSYEDARQTLADFIGATLADELVFTRSATESLNLVAEGWLRPRLQSGDVVWVSRQEHHSNYLPWQRVARDCGATVRIIELNDDGSLDLEGAVGLFAAPTRLIAVALVSNVLGITNPVAEIARRAREAGITLAIDAAQAVAHQPVDVQELGADFLAFSAHKMYGPDGIGALYCRSERLEELSPLLVGGGMVDRVGDTVAEWLPAPARLEAGSPNLTGAVGFAAAARWLNQFQLPSVAARLDELGSHARTVLDSVGDITVYSPPGTHILAFNLADVHPHDVAHIAGEHGVAVRAGHHCCQPLLRHLGTPATVRMSLGVYNCEQDIDALAQALRAAREIFGVRSA